MKTMSTVFDFFLILVLIKVGALIVFYLIYNFPLPVYCSFMIKVVFEGLPY